MNNILFNVLSRITPGVSFNLKNKKSFFFPPGQVDFIFLLAKHAFTVYRPANGFRNFVRDLFFTSI